MNVEESPLFSLSKNETEFFPGAKVCQAVQRASIVVLFVAGWSTVLVV